MLPVLKRNIYTNSRTMYLVMILMDTWLLTWLYSGEGGDKFLFGGGVSCLGLFKAVLCV